MPKVKKLTTKVFDLPDCPIDATCAAVDGDGTAHWFNGDPDEVEVTGTTLWDTNGSWTVIGGIFDSDNWENSKIIRPGYKGKKLTTEVFDYSDFPPDAVCAVVQPDGAAYWCVTSDLEIAEEPGGGWGLTKFAAKSLQNEAAIVWYKIGDGYDTTDWQHSMVVRPGFAAKVPDSGLPDSGKRESFNTGAVRDDAGDKPRPDLISPFFLERLGEHMRKGAIKYEANNWAKGIPNSRCWASLQRHLMKFAQGLHDEDHLAAAAFNLMAIIHNEEVSKRGIELKNPVTELVDMPLYGRKP